MADDLRSQREVPYRRLTLAEKQRVTRTAIREPAIACPHCEAKTTVDDLLTHIELRCHGRRPEHQYSAWIRAAEAADLGAGGAVLRRWVREQRVAAVGDGAQRRYLKRDVVRLLSMRVRPGARPKPASSRRAESRQLPLPL
jgi:hypothetical protein